MTTINSAVAYHFRREREHQRAVQTDGGGMITAYPCGRVELSYASSPYGEHALTAFKAAKRHVSFMRRWRARS